MYYFYAKQYNMIPKTTPKTVKIPPGLLKKLKNEMKEKKVGSFHKLMLMKLWA